MRVAKEDYHWHVAWSQMLSHHDCVRRICGVVGIGDHAIGKLRNFQFVIIALVAPKTSSAKTKIIMHTARTLAVVKQCCQRRQTQRAKQTRRMRNTHHLRIGTHARHLPSPNHHSNNITPNRQYRRCNVQPL